jgi:leukotriene-A4 hydrolase
MIKSTNERQHFIDYLPNDITTKEMAAIDQEFNFTKGGNFVIKRQWFLIAIAHEFQPAQVAIQEFMTNTSRTGSLIPLYKAILKTNSGKKRAQELFAKAKKGYHLTTIEALSHIVTQ